MKIKRGCAVLGAAIMLTACGNTGEGELHITTKETSAETGMTTAQTVPTVTASETTAEVTTAAATVSSEKKTTRKTTKKTTAKTTVMTTAETSAETAAEVTTETVTYTEPPVVVTETVTEQTEAETQPLVTVSETEKVTEETSAVTEPKEEEPVADTDPNAPPTTLFFVNTGEKETVITWDPSEGADGYEVLMKKNGTKWQLMGETNKHSFTITDIGLDKEYIFTVKAYKLVDGRKLYSDRSRNCGFPYMTKKDGVTYVDGLLVVNKTYGLPASYGWGLTSDTLAAFNEMQKGAAADGLQIWICSGFRNYSYQSTLYWNYVARDGSQWSADRYSARPGFSEHQSGYAIDVNQASRYFNGSPVAVWLEKNCWKYGFIIRYPLGKENVTGYNYESWHCRYVGKEKAKRLTESGLTIEEYYGLTSVYS